mgnify:FL=1
MVYSEELKIRDTQLKLSEYEYLEQLLDDYKSLNETLSSYEKDKKPIEKKIIRLEHKLSLFEGAIHQFKREFWMMHLSDLMPVSKMHEFIYGKFSTMENEIRKLAYKKEEDK